MAFDPNPKARSDLKPGTLYAVDGGAGWIYYGQYAPDGSVGFFRFRTSEPASAADVLRHPVMSRLYMPFNTSGQAMREGVWKKMGRHPVHNDLAAESLVVQWPVGTLTVSVWRGGEVLYDTRVEDPRIQELEIMAVWAWFHLPERLVADFGVEQAAWHVGGPIWRERLVKEENARRFPDEPWHELPQDWVPAERRVGALH
jgi:hypothetical protein